MVVFGLVDGTMIHQWIKRCSRELGMASSIRTTNNNERMFASLCRTARIHIDRSPAHHNWIFFSLRCLFTKRGCFFFLYVFKLCITKPITFFFDVHVNIQVVSNAHFIARTWIKVRFIVSSDLRLTTSRSTIFALATLNPASLSSFVM